MSDGIFISWRFGGGTLERLVKFQKQLALENPTPQNELHTTLLYGKGVHPEKVRFSNHFQLPLVVAQQPEVEVWNTEQGGKCVVLRYQSPDQENRHYELRNEYGADSDFPSYIPHVKLAYGEPQADQIRERVIDCLIAVIEERGEPLIDN